MDDNTIFSGSVWHCEDRERPRWAGGSLLHAVPHLFIASLLLASCAQAATESRNTADVITVDRLEPGRINSNRAGLSVLIDQPLADEQSRVSDSAAVLLASDGGRELFSFIVSCALPEGAVVAATLDGSEFDFFGAMGLTPEWRSSSLSLAGQRWVSACVFARVTAYSVAIPISARGPNLALAVSDDEREIFTLEEGAFYGNMFVPPDQPIQSFACRGRDEAAGEHGDLANRGCAEPDPIKPSLTQCGFVFTGDCGSFAADQACESFLSNGTYYRRCHTAPIANGPSDVYEQVVTMFVLP